MGKNEIEQFLSHLATHQKVARNTQGQAFNAILFLYKHVLDIPMDESIQAVLSRKPKRLPSVLTRDEIREVFNHLYGTYRLMAHLMYGSGLRLNEVLKLRIQDLIFSKNQIIVRDAKGNKDRVTLFPKELQSLFEAHLRVTQRIHKEDLAKGFGKAYMPEALSRKYPKASESWAWQFVFPAKSFSKDPRSGVTRRHHMHESGLQRAVSYAAKQTNILRKVTCHTFRHSFATHLLEDGVNIRAVQELLGHQDVSTTQIYTHVMDKSIDKIKSPVVDLLGDGHL